MAAVNSVFSESDSEVVDYIFVLNYIFFLLLCDSSVLDVLARKDNICGGTWSFVDRAKKVSDFIKTQKKSGEYAWFHLVELGCLAGYRNPPVAGFDLRDEAIKLANGGVKHNFPFDFDDYAKANLSSVPRYKVKRIRFKEWLQEGSWATAGASSEGKIEILDETSGKVKRIKCRKNFVLDAVEVDYLYNLCLSSKEQVNKTLLKCELGKIRLAVAGDLANYLITSYIVYLAGGCYLDWPGVTLEQKSIPKMERMIDIRDQLGYKIGVPFDFATFDHQPETPEVKSLMSVVVDAAKKTGSDEPEIFAILCETCVESFDHSILVTALDNTKHNELVLDVTGGVMSGHRATSILGNGYNAVVSSMVIECCVHLGENRKDFYMNVQGDDTNILCRSKRQGLMVIRLYQLFNIEFASGKFSVQPNNTEYLRVWYDHVRTYSYMARTLPNLVQRKPWTSQPWEAAGVLRSFWDKTGILFRRGADQIQLNQIWDKLRERWCQLHKIPIGAVAVPSELGGLGVGIWDGKTKVVPPLPKLQKMGFTIKAKTKWREENILTEAAKLGISDIDAAKAAEDQLSGVVSSDDVPAAAISNRTKWRRALERHTYQVVEVAIPKMSRIIKNPGNELWLSDNLTLFKQSMKLIRWDTVQYGSERVAVSRAIQAREYLRYSKSGLTLKKWIKVNEPVLFNKILRMQRFSHLAEILDYLGGNMSLGETVINSEMSDIYIRFCMTTISPYCRGCDLRANYAIHRNALITAFINSPIYQYVFATN